MAPQSVVSFKTAGNCNLLLIQTRVDNVDVINRLEKAEFYYKSHEYMEAINWANKALDLDSENAKAFYAISI